MVTPERIYSDQKTRRFLAFAAAALVLTAYAYTGRAEFSETLVVLGGIVALSGIIHFVKLVRAYKAVDHE